MRKILFLIPHPDDEVVGCCSIIRKFKKNGKQIYLFFITNGVLSEKSSWVWDKKKIKSRVISRKNEMKAVLKLLNIKDYFFQNIPTRTLKDNIPATLKRIKKIINLKQIDTIFCPAYEGGHQDHDVLNFISSKFLNRYKIYEFAEYNYFNRKINVNSFIKNLKGQKILELSKEEILFKEKCLEIYKSERKNLSYIKVFKECYRPLINYDYSKPPHKGILFYRRYSFFSWHPRVDKDKPQDICNKFLKFEEHLNKI